MKELTFEKKKLKISIEGKEVIVNYPTYFQLKSFAKKAESQGELEAITDLMLAIGMPEDILSQLDIDQVNEILKMITPDSKKKLE